MERVKFLHAADLHLGSPLNFTGKLPPEIGEKVRDAGYTAFNRLVDAAIRHGVEFVLLCGDIYDQTERSARAKRFFIDQMEKLHAARIPVYLIYGNHDPLSGQYPYFRYPDNVHIFPAEAMEAVEVTGIDGRVKARILGQSYSRPSEKRKMHLSFSPPDHDAVNIGMLHTALNPAQLYVPCSAAELKSIRGIDYWALGHIHQRGIVHSSYPTIAFPGIIQGRHMGEQGLGGCFLVTAQRGKAAEVLFIPTSSIAWLTCEVPVKAGDNCEDDLVSSMTELEEQILANEFMPDPGITPAPGESIALDGYMIRWVFTGRGEIHDLITGDGELGSLLTERMCQKFAGSDPFIWTEDVRFETSSPLVDLEKVSPEDVVLGALLQTHTEFQADPDARKEIIEIIGSSWFEQKDGEDTRDKAFPLDDHTYNYLVKSALQLAADRIVKGREQR